MKNIHGVKNIKHMHVVRSTEPHVLHVVLLERFKAFFWLCSVGKSLFSGISLTFNIQQVGRIITTTMQVWMHFYKYKYCI